MKKVPPYAPDELLAKYLAGEASSQEMAEVDAWIKEKEEHRHYFEEMQASWNALGVVEEEELQMVDKAWESLQQKIVPAKAPVRPLFSRWARIAAVGLILIVSAFAIVNWLNQPKITEIPVENLTEAPKLVDLPDGSNIALNQQSTLTYPSEFEDNQRAVSLRGEAFFDVKSNAEKPFIIEAGPIEVKVLGTSFNVRSFEAEDEVVVSVSTGRVEVINENSSVIITAGEEAVFNKINQTLQAEESVSSNFDSWRTGEFNFDATPLHAVIKALERTYQQKIKIENPEIEGCPISIENLKKSEMSLENLLEIIVATHPQFNIAKTEDGFLIGGESCNP